MNVGKSLFNGDKYGREMEQKRCFREIMQHEMQHDEPRMLILSHMMPRGRRFKSCCPD